MDIFEKHERFEIEVLAKLKNAGLLEPLLFGGGTMLRLCHELKRYSADLDFWFIKDVSVDSYFGKFIAVLERDYEITDSRKKHFTLLFEVRSGNYPKRLKIEIRKGTREVDFQEKIAFSKFSTKQVIVKAHTLEQTMKNKVEALIGRGEIRDAFDIEFLLRKGVDIQGLDEEQHSKLKERLEGFTGKDFKVKLGSVLERDIRNYYVENRFSYLWEKITP